MWPWGHLAVGYLLYSALIHLSGDYPRDYPTLALVFGTQFPDLVDKSLAWSFRILPHGRSLAHSLLTAAFLIVALQWILRRYGYSELSIAFGVGYLLHLAGDALILVVSGKYYYLQFLAWPLVSLPDETEKSFVAQLSSVEVSSFSTVDIGLFLLVFGLWVFDGRPGLRPILAVPRYVYGRLSAN